MIDQRAAEAVVAGITAAFEAGFGRIDQLDSDSTIKLTTTLDPPPPGARTIQYAVVEAFGDSAEEAIADWKHKLAKQPQTGRLLFWRTRPEVRSELDFCSGRRLWGIYSRFAVDP